MDTVISNMVELDENARTIIEEADQYSEQSHQKLSEAKEALRVQYQKEKEGRMFIEKQLVEQTLDQKTADSEKQCTERIKQLDAYFTKNHDELIENVYRYCLEGEEK